MKRTIKIMSIFLAFVVVFSSFIPLANADETVNDIKVKRIAGTNRLETSLSVGKLFTNSENVVIAAAESFPDALVGGNLAGALEAPLLITSKDSVSDGLLTRLEELGVKNVYLLGGENTLSNNVHKTLSEKFVVERIAGSDRFKTSEMVAEKIAKITENENPSKYFAYGFNFPDALAAAPLVSLNKGLLLLSDGKTAIESTGIAIGGENSVPGQAQERIAGGNRYETAIAIAEKLKTDSKTIILVDGTNYPDALSAGGYAAKINSPILLTPPKSLSPEVKAYIEEKGITEVLIIGGENSVSQAVVDSILGKDAKPTPDPAPVPDPTPTPSPGYDPSNPKDGLKISPYPDRQIKGNISSSGEKIYHVPGQRDYAKTEIDESKGERWFATEDEAKAAGWRKALR